MCLTPSVAAGIRRSTRPQSGGGCLTRVATALRSLALRINTPTQTLPFPRPAHARTSAGPGYIASLRSMFRKKISSSSGSASQTSAFSRLTDLSLYNTLHFLDFLDAPPHTPHQHGSWDPRIGILNERGFDQTIRRFVPDLR